MKRTIIFLLTLLIILSAFSISVNALDKCATNSVLTSSCDCGGTTCGVDQTCSRTGFLNFKKICKDLPSDEAVKEAISAGAIKSDETDLVKQELAKETVITEEDKSWLAKTIDKILKKDSALASGTPTPVPPSETSQKTFTYTTSDGTVLKNVNDLNECPEGITLNYACLCGADVCGNSLNERCDGFDCRELTGTEEKLALAYPTRCPQGDELITSTCACGSGTCTPGFYCDYTKNTCSETPVAFLKEDFVEDLCSNDNGCNPADQCVFVRSAARKECKPRSTIASSLTSKTSDVDDSCMDDGDCNSADKCVSSTCVPKNSCESNEDCSSGQTCEDVPGDELKSCQNSFKCGAGVCSVLLFKYSAGSSELYYDYGNSDQEKFDSGYYLQQTRGIYDVRGKFSVDISATTKDGEGNSLKVIAQSIKVECYDGNEYCFQDSEGNPLASKCISGRSASVSYDSTDLNYRGYLNVRGYSDANCANPISGATGTVTLAGYETKDEETKRIEIEKKLQEERDALGDGQSKEDYFDPNSVDGQSVDGSVDGKIKDSVVPVIPGSGVDVPSVDSGNSGVDGSDIGGSGADGVAAVTPGGVNLNADKTDEPTSDSVTKSDFTNSKSNSGNDINSTQQNSMKEKDDEPLLSSKITSSGASPLVWLPVIIVFILIGLYLMKLRKSKKSKNPKTPSKKDPQKEKIIDGGKKILGGQTKAIDGINKGNPTEITEGINEEHDGESDLEITVKGLLDKPVQEVTGEVIDADPNKSIPGKNKTMIIDAEVDVVKDIELFDKSKTPEELKKITDKTKEDLKKLITAVEAVELITPPPLPQSYVDEHLFESDKLSDHWRGLSNLIDQNTAEIYTLVRKGKTKELSSEQISLILDNLTAVHEAISELHNLQVLGAQDLTNFGVKETLINKLEIQFVILNEIASHKQIVGTDKKKLKTIRKRLDVLRNHFLKSEKEQLIKHENAINSYFASLNSKKELEKTFEAYFRGGDNQTEAGKLLLSVKEELLDDSLKQKLLIVDTKVFESNCEELGIKESTMKLLENIRKGFIKNHLNSYNIVDLNKALDKGQDTKITNVIVNKIFAEYSYQDFYDILRSFKKFLKNQKNNLMTFYSGDTIVISKELSPAVESLSNLLNSQNLLVNDMAATFNDEKVIAFNKFKEAYSLINKELNEVNEIKKYVDRAHSLEVKPSEEITKVAKNLLAGVDIELKEKSLISSEEKKLNTPTDKELEKYEQGFLEESKKPSKGKFSKWFKKDKNPGNKIGELQFNN